MNVNQIPSIKMAKKGLPYVKVFVGTRDGDSTDEAETFVVSFPMTLQFPIDDESGMDEDRTVSNEDEFQAWIDEQGFDSYDVRELPLCDSRLIEDGEAKYPTSLYYYEPNGLLEPTSIELNKEEATIVAAVLNASIENILAWLDAHPTASEESVARIHRMGDLGVLKSKVRQFLRKGA